MDPFRIRDHVLDFDDIVQDLVARSQRVRATVPMVADVSYGSDPTETIDLFFPPGSQKNLPVHMFIHGGYWRAFSKRDYSYVADTIVGAGAIAVVVDYALMPKVRLATIINQVRRAKSWILEHIQDYRGDPGRITISGHSAGAHLSTFLFHTEDGPSRVRGAMLLGGLYDLKPLQASFLRNEIGLTDKEVTDCTPLRFSHDPNVQVMIAVGAEETPPFHRQAEEFATLLRRQGLETSVTYFANANHMSSVRDLGAPGSLAGASLVRLVQNS